jgi:hypothetical protein
MGAPDNGATQKSSPAFASSAAGGRAREGVTVMTVKTVILYFLFLTP